MRCKDKRYIYVYKDTSEGTASLTVPEYSHELCFSIYGDDDIIKIKNEMENSIENLRVPFKVDVAQGKSWGETHDNDK